MAPATRRSLIPSLCSVFLAASCARTAPDLPAAAEAEPTPVPAARPAATPAPTAASAAPFVSIPGAARPLPGVLTGGQPTADQLEEAARLGYRTVITLRPDSEPGAAGERERVEALGMRFVSLPIAGLSDLTESNARALSAALSGDESKPAIVHCGTGNRAGALLALEAYYLRGESVDAAIALGKQAGLTALEPAVRNQLERSRR